MAPAGDGAAGDASADRPVGTGGDTPRDAAAGSGGGDAAGGVGGIDALGSTDLPANGERLGEVVLRQEGGESVAEARFFVRTMRPPQAFGLCGSCTEYHKDSCVSISCPTGSRCLDATYADPQPFAYQYASAGSITVTRPVGAALVLPPPTSGAYWPVRAPGPLGDPGQPLTVEAEGAAVSPFRGSVAIPGSLELTEPPASATTWERLPSRIRWRPSSGGSVEVSVKSLFMPDMGGTETTTTCTAPAEAGDIVVPPLSFSVPRATVTVRRIASSKIAAGSFDVTLRVVSAEFAFQVSTPP